MSVEAPERPTETTAAPKAPSSSPLGQLGEILKNHIQLAFLEGQFELVAALKRVAVFAVCAVLGVTAYVLVQVAIVSALMHAGLPLWAACLIMIGLYGAVMTALILFVGKRDLRAGAPFQATRDELQRSRQWIRKRFF